tara:strand:- start:2075 stop:2686 length:612 start_codon:yes stop_codon:yes gene_type:complete
MDTLLIDNFSRIVGRLLSEENKDKLLGEISEDLEQYIADIKNMVDSGTITYDKLRDEISNNLNITEDQRPGSVAQMLLGCIDEESCPMRQEEVLDIPYFYDKEQKKIIPMTKITNSFTSDSYAVIYITGNPSDISIDALRDLEENGFTKIKIMYKKSTKSKYKTFNIDNLNLYMNPQNMFNYKTGALVMVLLSIILFLIYKRH